MKRLASSLMFARIGDIGLSTIADFAKKHIAIHPTDETLRTKQPIQQEVELRRFAHFEFRLAQIE